VISEDYSLPLGLY